MGNQDLSDSVDGPVYVAATTDLEAARSRLTSTGGILYADDRPLWEHLPFRGLLVVAEESAAALDGVGDVGVYRAYRRVLKPGRARVVGLFPLCRAPGMSHEAADAHWRDVHGPLALIHHGDMTEYVQLSVEETRSGATFDGFALCGFETPDDVRHRFYSTTEGPGAIAEDVRRFADVKRSPRRLVAQVERYLS